MCLLKRTRSGAYGLFQLSSSKRIPWCRSCVQWAFALALRYLTVTEPGTVRTAHGQQVTAVTQTLTVATRWVRMAATLNAYLAFGVGFCSRIEVSDGNGTRHGSNCPRPAKSADRGYHTEVTPGIHPADGSRVERPWAPTGACVQHSGFCSRIEVSVGNGTRHGSNFPRPAKALTVAATYT